MTSTWQKCLQLFALLALTFTSAHSLPQKRVPLTPANDPFYVPPSGFEAESPGAILRTRTVITSFLGLLPTGVQSYQLLYRTTSANGSAIAAVTTVFKPLIAKTDRFVSFHTAYDGSAPICDPSYNYQLFAAQVDLISDVEFLLAEAFLLAGYVVSAPDYEGTDAAFGAGRLAGMVVLDSIRAVSSFSSAGFTTKTPKVVGYGYSGGSIASGWAAQLQSTYAPELPIAGWAAGGVVANLTGTALFIDNTISSGFLPAALVGLTKPSSYGAELNPIVSSIITPHGQSVLDFAKENCIADLLNFSEQSVLDTSFQSLGDQLYYQPQIAQVLALQTMGVNKNETPVAPVYVFHATPDEIIPYSNATTLVNSWCANGASVDFVTYAAGGHFTTEILGFVGAFQFVEKAFAGTVSTTGCTSSTQLDETLNALALGVNLEPVLIGLIDALAALGRKDANVVSNPRVLSDTTVST